MYSRIDDYVRHLVKESTPERSVWNVEKLRQGKSSDWNYIDGCMITALLEMSRITGDKSYFDFCESYISHFVREDGSILTYKPEKFNLDDINEGRTLFELYERTGKDKYRLAAELLHRQLETQPRTFEGSFWHKAIYPDQVWLDGIYMAQPFYVKYEKYLGRRDYSDTEKQILTVRDRMRDGKTGLYFHGYDASRTAFWANRTTGCSENFWLRSIGWFAVALADILDEACIPSVHEVFSDLMESVLRFSDPDTGLYWQVVNFPGRQGNYLETSGSAMLSYAMMKGARLGLLKKEYAAKGRKTFDGIVNKYLAFSETGLELGGICLVAGLGPENNRRRDGSYEYYISEPVVSNDAKGAAPFVLAYTEVKRLQA